MSAEVYRLGELTLDVENHLLSRGAEVVPLPPKTFELLLTLVRRAPGVVTRQELFDSVWPNETVNDEALTQRVMLLRRSLGDDPKDPAYIASAPRWGYRLVAPVARLPSEPETQPAPPSQPASDPSSLSGLQRAIVSIRRRDRWLMAGVLGLAGIVAVAAIYHELGSRRGAIDSLAIAPFTAIAAEGADETLCEGIPATLTATMTKVPHLRVIASSTMARYRGRHVDPQRVGRELGVHAVLTGSLARHDGVIVIDTELVDVKDGSLLWSSHLERRLTDIFALQDELSRDIAVGMRLELSGAERSRLASRATTNVEAYTFYLRGRNFWNRRDEEGFDQAIACFRSAIDLDPSYALAYSGLADCLALEGSMEYGIAPPAEMMPKARSAATRALEADPGLAEAHASFGLVLWLYEWDRERAEVELRRAVDLRPGYATAHQWLAELLAEQGRADEAGQELQRAEALDPLSRVISADRGLLAYYRRDFAAAIRNYRTTVAMDPSFIQARLGLGLAYAQQGEHDEALAVLREANRLAGGIPPTMSALGYADGLAGRTAEARELLNALLELRKKRYVSALCIGGVLIGLGDHDGAFAWLERAREERASLLGALPVWPVFDPLRPDPRFQVLLKEVRLRSAPGPR